MKLAWHLEWSKEAIKELSKIEQKEAKRIIKKLEVCLENPFSHFERLSGYEDYKIRAGNYRAICLLVFQTNTIIVQKVGHRKNIYKRFEKQ